jgi:hypothetical protein
VTGSHHRLHCVTVFTAPSFLSPSTVAAGAQMAPPANETPAGASTVPATTTSALDGLRSHTPLLPFHLAVDDVLRLLIHIVITENHEPVDLYPI